MKDLEWVTAGVTCPGRAFLRVPSWSSGDSAFAGAGRELRVGGAGQGVPSWVVGAAANPECQCLVVNLQDIQYVRVL